MKKKVFIFLFNPIFMSSPDSSHTYEDKGLNVKNIGSNVTYNTIKGNQNVTIISVGKNFKINSQLIPVRKTIGNGIDMVQSY